MKKIEAKLLDPKRKLFRWGPISACPLFMYFTVEPAFIPLKKGLGLCFPLSVVIFRNNQVLWMLDEEDFIQTSQKFCQLTVFNNKGKLKYLALWKKRTENLKDAFEKLEKLKFDKLPDNSLSRAYKNFSKVYWSYWTITMSLDLVTTSLIPAISDKLKTYIKAKNLTEFDKSMVILTTPAFLTFYRQEQRDLIRVLEMPLHKRQQALQDHQKIYFWMHNSYLEAKVLDINFFENELQELGSKDFQALKAEIDTYVKSTLEKKNNLLDELNASQDFRSLIELADQFAQKQDERKMFNFIGDHYLEEFVNEFARRTNRSVEDIKLLLPDELKDAIVSFSESNINKRKECLLFLCSDNGLEQIVGQNALAIANSYDTTVKNGQAVIKGTLASTGNVETYRGKVKLVPTIKDILKLEEGDVLVTTMTSPDYVIGMKKAGAIITDVGGLLSHAAIVSRELGKPCIVGTEIATKLLHDDDVVEIDCQKGTFKIVSQT